MSKESNMLITSCFIMKHIKIFIGYEIDMSILRRVLLILYADKLKRFVMLRHVANAEVHWDG